MKMSVSDILRINRLIITYKKLVCLRFFINHVYSLEIPLLKSGFLYMKNISFDYICMTMKKNYAEV